MSHQQQLVTMKINLLSKATLTQVQDNLKKMNKSLLAVLLVCAFAGLAYAAPYDEATEQKSLNCSALSSHWSRR